MGHHVRTRLDELKRQEVSRLRMLLKAKLDSTNAQSECVWLCHACPLPCIAQVTLLSKKIDVCSHKCFTGVQMDHASLLRQFEHLDPHNQNTFEAKDLELLIATVTDVQNMP